MKSRSNMLHWILFRSHLEFYNLHICCQTMKYVSMKSNEWRFVLLWKLGFRLLQQNKNFPINRYDTFRQSMQSVSIYVNMYVYICVCVWNIKTSTKRKKIIVCLFGANISLLQTFFRYHLHVDGIISFLTKAPF